MKSCLFLLCLLLCSVTPLWATNGLTLDAKHFSYNAKVAFGSSYWARKPMTGFVTNSLNVSFYGIATATCPTKEHGPTAGHFPWAKPAELLTPSPQLLMSPVCPQTGETGSSYITMQDGQGVGMYCHAGKDPNLSHNSVLLPYPKDTPGRSGISATYLEFKPDWVVRPWSGPKQILSIITQQAVTARVVDNTKTQVQQNSRLVILNYHCFTNKKPGQSCQFEWNAKLYLEGINPTGQTEEENIMFDPAQGGIPVIVGTTEDAPYWTNKGAPTQRAPSDELKTFNVEMDWAQAQNLLIKFTLIALKNSGTIQSTVTTAEVAKHFGDKWQHPNEWVVINIGVGQEVVNFNIQETASISGLFKTLDVVAN